MVGLLSSGIVVTIDAGQAARGGSFRGAEDTTDRARSRKCCPRCSFAMGRDREHRAADGIRRAMRNTRLPELALFAGDCYIQV